MFANELISSYTVFTHVIDIVICDELQVHTRQSKCGIPCKSWCSVVVQWVKLVKLQARSA